MDPPIIGSLSIIALLALILLGLPVAYTLGGLGVLGLAFLLGPKMAVGHVASAAYSMSAQYSWAVFPMFIVMGNLAGMAGIINEAFDAARKWLGRLPGGLAMATCAASGVFSACSGSTVVNAAVFTPLALPQMLKSGYDKRLSVGCIAAAGTFATMIPPSITMVIYGVITEEPIGKLLVAGIIPGILTIIVYLVGIYVRVIRRPHLAPVPQLNVTWGEKLRSLRGLWGILLIFLVIMGGIDTGWFAPSAAGAVGAFATFLLVAGRRRMNWPGLKSAFLDSVMVTSSIFIIIIGGSLYGRFLTVSGVATDVSRLVMGLPMPSLVIICMFILMYLMLGCFMDPPSIMVITLPIIHPIIIKLGFDGIWFGILIVKIVEIAMITPPVGFNVYVVHSAAGGRVQLEDVFAGVTPFLLLEIIILSLIIAFPQLSLWLPGKMQ